ncbi:MAG: hypothetical protein ABIQ16_15330 [Polyangiaceae bacterium]
MSVIHRARSALTVGVAAVGICFAALPGCAAVDANRPSTVARGKYYSSGEAHYDEFFISLYWMQVAMADAPRVPENERLALAKALSLPPGSDTSALGARLREEAQRLSLAGIHLRLDQTPAPDKFAQASVTLRSSARPKDDPSAVLLRQVEQSGTNLLRSIDDMTQGEENLRKFAPQAANLDAVAEVAFADTRVGKLGEVRKNLADARQLIPLMLARATEVHHESEALLLELSKAVNTDDGSLGPAPGAEPNAEPVKAPDSGKKTAAKARPKAKPSGVTPPPAARPKAAPGGDAPAPAPAPAPKPSKAPAAPRDFEP